MRELGVGAGRIELVRGDITRQNTDAIVNAANSGLRGGGGVDGAIHRAGGPTIMEQCRKIGGCPTGEARITSGGRLAAKYVVHAVGPVYHGGRGDEAALLASAYRRSVEAAVGVGATSLSFPSISTGVYGYPIAEAAPIALRSVAAALRAHRTVTLARFVLFSDEDLRTYEAALAALAATLKADVP
jgi:O-acetyl-ADP-ribose deacetylase (regulator of RNase III)